MSSSSFGYPGFSPSAMEAWFRLMAEAMRGVQEAQQAFEAFAQMSGTPQEWQRWMKTYMPYTQVSATPEVMEQWVEDWQAMLGVVPRHRYLDLLQKNDELQRRLEKAEETIATLRRLLAGNEAQSDAAHQVMDTWSKMLEDTLKTQTEWMRQWSDKPEEDRNVSMRKQEPKEKPDE